MPMRRWPPSLAALGVKPDLSTTDSDDGPLGAGGCVALAVVALAVVGLTVVGFRRRLCWGLIGTGRLSWRCGLRGGWLRCGWPWRGGGLGSRQQLGEGGARDPSER